MTKILTHTISHDIVKKLDDLVGSRAFYERLRSVLRNHFHYWLQRGSLEVEGGDLTEAESCLQNAAALQPNNQLLATELAYLEMSRACNNPAGIESESRFLTAFQILEDQVARRRDAHPLHILGNQGLAWADRFHTEPLAKTVFLRRLDRVVSNAKQKHPFSPDVSALANRVKEALLLASTTGPSP